MAGPVSERLSSALSVADGATVGIASLAFRLAGPHSKLPSVAKCESATRAGALRKTKDAYSSRRLILTPPIDWVEHTQTVAVTACRAAN